MQPPQPMQRSLSIFTLPSAALKVAPVGQGVGAKRAIAVHAASGLEVAPVGGSGVRGFLHPVSIRAVGHAVSLLAGHDTGPCSSMHFSEFTSMMYLGMAHPRFLSVHPTPFV